mgnify:FL=1|jgi:hypothetical protein|tara:strand:+ start:1495 stop:1692 length:198 start_codon:yes stop_codon:yes gene_type:complete
MKKQDTSGGLPLDNWPERYKTAYTKVFDELPEWKKADIKGNDRHSSELIKAVIKLAENDENFLDN